MKKEDMLLLSALRTNSRETLTKISKQINIPISTIFDKLRTQEIDIIKKHTSILDFSKIGYSSRANIILKVHKNDKEDLKEFLLTNSNVNSVYRINNGYDFLIEVIFRTIIDLEGFVEKIEGEFRLKTKHVHYIIEDLKREAFLAYDEENKGVV